jgi:hypothetical protein
MKFAHELGRQAKDKITGFKGIIIGRTEYLFGCNVYGLSPETLADGKRMDTEWFDEGRIEIIGRGVLPKEVKAKKNGSEYHEVPKM